MAGRMSNRANKKSAYPLGIRTLHWLNASSRPDSNRRPTHYECVALPTALRKHKNLLEEFSCTKAIKCFGHSSKASNDLAGNRTRVYAVRGRRLSRLTTRPYENL